METEVVNVYTIYDCKKSIQIIDDTVLVSSNDNWMFVG